MFSSLLAGVLARPWARRVAIIALAALTITLFLLNLRRMGERAGRAAERINMLEPTNEVQRRMLQAAVRRPRDRNELVDRLRDGGF
nr:hypothetical protein [Pararhodobacter zhoushanensis]